MSKDIRPEKLQDMVRSILPSKNREAARKAKATECRRARRVARMDVRNEDFDESAVDFFRDADQSSNVQWRRGGDKLNHFLRWCRVRTRGMTTREALDYVRRLLPRNLIGDHAYSHWETEMKYRGRRGSAVSWLEGRRRTLEGFIDQTAHRLRHALELDPTVVGSLNAEIKRRKVLDEPRRLLRGVHDVEAFVREILLGRWDVDDVIRHGWPHRFGVERNAVMTMLAEVEIANGPKRKVRRHLPHA